MKEGLTFDDVLLIPQKSNILSRKEIDLSIKLHKKINLNIPIISSPMDTVTESTMAIAMARNGGLGIIHRFCSIEDQVKQVEKVKRAENYLIKDPICISPNTTLREIKIKSEEYDFQTFLVVDEKKKLLGLISKRDYLLEDNENKKAFQLMTPFEKLVVSYKKISFSEAKNIFRKYKIEKIPIVDKKRRVLGLITFKDFKNSLNKKASRDKNGKLIVGAAIGIRGDYLERAQELIRAGVDILCIDIAHGHLEKSIKVVREVKNKFPNTPLIAGNIATTEGASDLKNAGADIIKVGIGPGSACTTRIVAGVGVPQLSAIILAKKGAGNIPIIADGGCRNSGDIVKALAAGASAVMLGSLLAGTEESPGEIFYMKGKRVKAFRGMASAEAYKNKIKSTNDNLEYEPISEGINYGFIEYKGSVNDVLINLEKGLRSGLSYCGAKNIKELWKKAKFIKISENGYRESLPHSINFLD
ncbi:MAG: inosine-5'-monophosphate dehydrogenase [Candidatus Parcubacteria bacterium]|nr:MAG: inosine-5'-monophosphate dehydrogenase [Candidatus Parcubacteria bacterium]